MRKLATSYHSAQSDNQELAFTYGNLDRPQIEGDFPTPPAELRLYGESEERHLVRGRDMAECFRQQICLHAKERTSRVFLEFGCSNGRIIRHFSDWSQEGSRGWGVDIDSTRVHWCRENLSPPFHFLVCTTAPHLPFRDGEFDICFACSVFTHIDDLALSWLMELKRILRPTGLLLATFHDENSLESLTSHPDKALSQIVLPRPEFQEFIDSNRGMLSLRRRENSEYCDVFYKRKFLKELLSPYFDILQIVENAGGISQSLFTLRSAC